MPRKRFRENASALKARAERVLLPSLPVQLIVIGDFAGNKPVNPLCAERSGFRNKLSSRALTKFTLPKTRRDLEIARAKRFTTLFDYVGTPGIRISVTNHIRQIQIPGSTEVLDVELWFECMEDFAPGRIVERLPELRHVLDEHHNNDVETDRMLSAELDEASSSSSELATKLQFLPDTERNHCHTSTCTRPCLAIIADFEFNPQVSDADTFMLERLGAAAAIAHAAFISAVGPQVFKAASFAEVSKRDPLYNPALCGLNSPALYRWREFRKARDSSYCVLTLPRLRLRNPYSDQRLRYADWKYTERVAAMSDYLWSNAAYAIGTCIITAYAQRGWCLEIHGSKNGTVRGLRPHSPVAEDPSFEAVPQVECSLSNYAAAVLANEGFALLEYDLRTGTAVFWTVKTCYDTESPDTSDERRLPSLERLTSGELGYVLVECQIARYIEGKQWQNKRHSAVALQHEIADWIGQYVAHPKEAQRKFQFPYSPILPFTEALVEVRGVPGYRDRVEVKMLLQFHSGWVREHKRGVLKIDVELLT